MSGPLVSVVFKISRAKRDAVQQLAKDTRVRQSEYMREAINDLLNKRRHQWDDSAERSPPSSP